MTDLDFRSDCARCAALCCVALSFDKSRMFGHDKAAGEPCRHLAPGGCAIHTTRAEQGYRGCIAYECLGAGPFVTQALFQGRDWRDDPALLPDMIEAFSASRQLREKLMLVREALRLGVPATTAAEGQRLAADLAAAIRENRPAPELLSQTAAFLKSLKPFVSRQAARG